MSTYPHVDPQPVDDEAVPTRDEHAASGGAFLLSLLMTARPTKKGSR